MMPPTQNPFALQWRFVISVVRKLKWFFPLKLALYIKNEKYNNNNSVNQCSVIVIGVFYFLEAKSERESERCLKGSFLALAVLAD